MFYFCLAIFITFMSNVIFHDGIFANALSTTVFFIIAIPIVLILYSYFRTTKEEEIEKERKEKEEKERQKRIANGHLEDALTPKQRAVWNALHKFYRTDEKGAEEFIKQIKLEHERDLDLDMYMYHREHKDDYLVRYHNDPWSHLLRQADLHDKFMREYKKKAQEKGLLDENGEYTFWDNFPDNWKMSDEELAALDKDDE